MSLTNYHFMCQFTANFSKISCMDQIVSKYQLFASIKRTGCQRLAWPVTVESSYMDYVQFPKTPKIKKKVWNILYKNNTEINIFIQ